MAAQDPDGESAADRGLGVALWRGVPDVVRPDQRPGERTVLHRRRDASLSGHLPRRSRKPVTSARVTANLQPIHGPSEPPWSALFRGGRLEPILYCGLKHRESDLISTMDGPTDRLKIPTKVLQLPGLLSPAAESFSASVEGSNCGVRAAGRCEAGDECLGDEGSSGVGRGSSEPGGHGGELSLRRRPASVCADDRAQYQPHGRVATRQSPARAVESADMRRYRLTVWAD